MRACAGTRSRRASPPGSGLQLRNYCPVVIFFLLKINFTKYLISVKIIYLLIILNKILRQFINLSMPFKNYVFD